MSAPKPVCEVGPEGSLTCPCDGFAYGEGGDLAVVRLRNGKEIDHLDITPYFQARFHGEGQMAVVQRWAPDYDHDFEASKRSDFRESVSKRRVVQVMFLHDYDHDAWQAEFYLQTAMAPCGHSFGLVIGISKKNRTLHVFGTASKPSKPLLLQKEEWEALRKATGPVEVLDWACADHAAETETRLRLHWTSEGIEGTRRVFTCPPDGGHLIEKKPL
jgi:hypothetical protein